MTATDGTEPTHLFGDAEAWEEWLAQNHHTYSGVWLKIAKKHSGAPGVSIADALDVALCYGWIDSQRRRLDDRYYLQRYSPRRRSSPWSQINVEKVARLSAEGRMRPPGLAEVEAARRDGRWEAAYPRQSHATTPPDLEDALRQRPRARAAFDALSKTVRYAILLELAKARTDAARSARLRRTVARLEET